VGDRRTDCDDGFGDPGGDHRGSVVAAGGAWGGAHVRLKMGPWEARTRRAERLAAAWRSGVAPLELERLIELLGNEVVANDVERTAGVGSVHARGADDTWDERAGSGGEGGQGIGGVGSAVSRDKDRAEESEPEASVEESSAGGRA